jgi:asparagine synthase (glutamine-hydrolysing)
LAGKLLSDSGPIHTVSLVYERWSALARETQFIRETLGASPYLAPHMLVADDIYDFEQFLDPPPTDEPWPGLYHVSTEKAMYDMVAAAGADSILTGFGGDEVTDLLPYNVADCLRDGRPRGAWHMATQWAAEQNRNVWNVFWPYGLMPLIPAPLRGGFGTFIRRGRARWSELDDYWIPPWIHPDFSRKYDLYDRVLCNLRRARSFDLSLQVSDSLNMIVSRNGDMIRWYLGAPRGIHTGNPFFDPRVIRYALAARTRIPFCPGRQKPLLADAMNGILPDSIRNRRRKGNFNEVYFIGLSRHGDYLEAMIENAPVDDLAFLDKELLLRCFREFRMARASNLRALGRITITLAVLNWLSHYKDWIHVLPSISQSLQWIEKNNAQ